MFFLCISTRIGPDYGIDLCLITEFPKFVLCPKHGPYPYPYARSDGMKSAYVGDFGGFLRDLDDLRGRMESWYALRLEDEKVVGDQMTQYEKVTDECDTLITKITTSMRVVKNAIVPSSKISYHVPCFSPNDL